MMTINRVNVIEGLRPESLKCRVFGIYAGLTEYIIRDSERRYTPQKMVKNRRTLGLSAYTARVRRRNKYEEHAIDIPQQMVPESTIA
jgi:hypothetical protein